MPKSYRRIFLKRSEVALSRLMPADAEWLETWVNDPTTTRWMATGRVQSTLDQVVAQIMHWQEPRDWPFAVLISDQKEIDGQYQAIGTVGLYDADLLTRKAEFRILLGAPHTGKGYGTEATRLVLDFGFQRLGLHRIWLGVTDANIPAVKCYEKCGFTREGLLRDDLFRDGHFYDSIRMSILDTEWRTQWRTGEARPAGISVRGPSIQAPAAGLWTCSWPTAVASQDIAVTPPSPSDPGREAGPTS